MSASLTLGSLCAGVAVFDLAFTLAGFDVRYQVEKNPFCRRVLEARRQQFFPNALIFEDVAHVGKHNLPAVDALCAGFPCQPVSNAGKRRGIEDGRWLWHDIARIIAETQPKVCFLENVQGLYTANAGRAFESVLRDLAACGYDAEWACLRASATVGAPHVRPRWFCIAWRTDIAQNHANTDGIGQGEPQTSTRGEPAHSLQRTAETAEQTWQQLRSIGRSGETDFNPSRTGRKEFDSAAEPDTPGYPDRRPAARWRKSARRTQSDMGRTVPDGITRQLDKPGRYPYWAAPLDSPQWDYEPPRLASDIPYRAARVEALGNSAVLPLVYELACVVREKLLGMS